MSRSNLFVLLVILFLSIPLIFYKLGQTSLVSWDEAWYASISQNILKTGDLLRLNYNGSLFADKPPVGMWLTAINFKLFGISTLTARLGSAICAILSLYFLYLLGTKLFNKFIGFSAAISLFSSFWFLYRARSGNLDVPLVFFYTVTIYLGVLATENKKYLWLFAVALGLLSLIKGIVFALILLPVIIIIFWKNKICKVQDVVLALLLGFGLFGIWIGLQALQDPSQAMYHFTHSLRDSSLNNDFLKSARLFKQYLHSGIGVWFWPGVLAIVGGLVFRQRRFFILSVFFASFSLPFIFSPEVHIWHLIPLHPFMILAIYAVSYEFGNRLLKSKFLVNMAMLTLACYFSAMQLNAAWYQFIDIPAYVSDEEILGRQASKYAEKLYLDGDYVPAVAFYADKIVLSVDNHDLNKLFANEKDFLLITNDWRLQSAQISPSRYELIKKDRDKVLVRH